MEHLKNLDYDKFLETLSKEDKVKFLLFIIDNDYYYEEDEREDSIKNEEVQLFILKHSKYSKLALDMVKKRSTNVSTIASHQERLESMSDDKPVKNDDCIIDKIVAFKELRANKLKRILNEM